MLVIRLRPTSDSPAEFNTITRETHPTVRVAAAMGIIGTIAVADIKANVAHCAVEAYVRASSSY